MSFLSLSSIILLSCLFCSVVSIPFLDNTEWNDLKVTWGYNPLEQRIFESMPKTESEAQSKGWIKEKSCGQINGNRYILDNDRSVLLVYNALGKIAGIATSIPKGLPFNMPSSDVKKLFTDEGDYYTLTGYFTDPDTVCSKTAANGDHLIGDRLVFKGDNFKLDAPMSESKVGNLWTKGKCFYTMGVHYWTTMDATPVDKNTSRDQFVPIFLLYNRGRLTGFGWALNADLDSSRYEHPEPSANDLFFQSTPKYMKDSTQIGKQSTLHIYFDNMPLLDLC